MVTSLRSFAALLADALRQKTPSHREVIVTSPGPGKDRDVIDRRFAAAVSAS